MSGIKNLSEIYEKQGKGFVEKLFSEDVTITENLDGSAFSFEKDFIGNNISFYKKDQENPITRVDRILMTYYEKPINYIESLPNEIKEEIPRGWRFGMLYFPNTKPVRIEYDRVPKNHLILTHITVRDEFGDNIRSVQNKEELDQWAEKLGVEKSPIIFQGKLDQDQKISIMDFLSTPLLDLRNRFKTESFSKYIISLINPEMAKTTLGNDLHGEIDSLVFRFINKGKEEEVLAKMIDPIFYELSRERKVEKSSYFPNDVYSLCLIDVMNFILEEGIESFDADGIEPEERYINFVFSVFKKFIENYGDKYIGVDFNKPLYLQSEDFKLNREFIVDNEVIMTLDKDESFEDILQMILNSFRKLKRKPHGFFTEGLIQEFNNLVEEIASYINAKKKEKIEEAAGIPSFVWFKKVGTKMKIFEEEEFTSDEKESLILESETFTEEKEENEGMKEEEETKNASEFFSFRDFKKVVATNKEKKKIKILNEEKDKVNLLIGKFQPFNNGHLKMCTRLKKENGYPVFLCVVHPGENVSKKYPFSNDLIKKSIGSLTSENGNLFSGYQFIPTNLLEDAMLSVCEKMNPVSVCVGEKDFENTLLQREWIKNKYDLGGNEIEIFKTPTWSDNNKVRESIKEGNFQEFKSSVPKPIAVLFNEFVRETSEKEDI
jgi:nicotinamide mononucleotide adenylyltransferase